MTKLKTISIKGKAYVEVKERLKHFRKTYQHEYGLVTNVLSHTSDSILLKAEIIDKTSGFIVADGIAFEESASSFINKGNYVENCQTYQQLLVCFSFLKRVCSFLTNMSRTMCSMV